MYKRSVQGWLKHWDFILTDEFSLLLAAILIYKIEYHNILSFLSESSGFLCLILAVNLFAIVADGTFDHILFRGFLVELKQILKHGFFSLSLFAIVMLIRDELAIHGRNTLFSGCTVYIVITWVARTLLKKFLKKHPKRAQMQALLIVVPENNAVEIIENIRKYSFTRFTIAGLVLTDRQASGEFIDGIPVVANLENAADYICREWIDNVLLFRTAYDAGTLDLIEKCREMAVTLHITLSLRNIEECKQSIERIGGYEVVTANVNMMSFHDAILKRVFDVVAGVVGSILACIAVLTFGPIICVKSPDPIIYTQERIGENGRHFKIFKIRTMHTDADDQKQSLAGRNAHNDSMMFKMDFDPRVIGNEVLPDGTQKRGIGDFLRKTNIDELPQFWNVLKGEMSVVGTRPPTLDEWEKYSYKHRSRMSIKPGLTGLWQIHSKKDKMEFDQTVALDTEYISNWTFRLDLKIVFRTVSRILQIIAGKQDGDAV